MRGAALALLLAGCYSPAPKSGAYRCSAADSACPLSQHCVCGLCVNHDEDAACAFSVDATQTPKVGEHESFPVTIEALKNDHTPAAGFANTVTLSFGLPDGTRWCDVSPSSVQLSGGKATVMVTLNRETVPPQKPRLKAEFAGNQGQSAGVEVTAPPFVKDTTATVAPVGPNRPFGWTDTFVAEPSVLYDGSGFRMYFVGESSKSAVGVALGLATSTDGVSFAPKADPVFSPADNSWYSAGVEGPAAFFAKSGSVALAFTGFGMTPEDPPATEIGVAGSSDGLSGFTVLSGGNPVIRRSIPGQHMADCDYCTDSVSFPHVIDDPAGGSLDGGEGAKLMFFSATQNKVPSIGRASSADGVSWLPEPAPVLSGDIGGEAILLTPHVLVDGSVFKMWYSFARLGDALAGTSMCDLPVRVGYATSSDGFYWVRSPGNSTRPAIDTSTTGWDAGIVAFLAGTVLPKDGSNAGSGFVLYYTTFRHGLDAQGNPSCVPNGIGRATRM